MRVVLAGYYGFGNGGDEALLLTVLQMLPPKVKPVVLSANPEQTRAAYGVEAVDRWNGWAVWRALRTADGLVWGGGSLMQDSTSWRNPLYYGGLMVLAGWLGLRRVAWAQGIGPLRRSWTRALTVWCLRRCKAVSVRDRASAALLDSWNVPYKLAPDPVWAMEASDCSSHWPDPAVAIVLRSHPHLTAKRLAVLQRALIYLRLQTGAHLLLLPFQAADRPLSEQLQAALADGLPVDGDPDLRDLIGKNRKSDSSQIVQIDDPRRLKGTFRHVQLAIAMRLHGVIMAAAEGVPTYALSYDPKVTQLMEAESISGCELEQLPENAEALGREWVALLQQSGLTREQRDRLRQDTLVHRELLHRALLD